MKNLRQVACMEATPHKIWPECMQQFLRKLADVPDGRPRRDSISFALSCAAIDGYIGLKF